MNSDSEVLSLGYFKIKLLNSASKFKNYLKK